MQEAILRNDRLKSYDDNGNLICMSGTSTNLYVYDDQNRLVAVTKRRSAGGTGPS